MSPEVCPVCGQDMTYYPDDVTYVCEWCGYEDEKFMTPLDEAEEEAKK